MTKSFSRRFPLFQSHIDLAHQYWKQILFPGDTVIDATCGNGHDALILAQLALSVEGGFFYGFDRQEAAIQNTRQRLEEFFPAEFFSKIHLIRACHSKLALFLPEANPIKLIVYNLGYLPGGDKRETTEIESTLASVIAAQKLVMPGGVISITCYPGHAEGKKEEDILLEHAATLSPHNWSCCFHGWLNRKLSPGLLILQKV